MLNNFSVIAIRPMKIVSAPRHKQTGNRGHHYANHRKHHAAQGQMDGVQHRTQADLYQPHNAPNTARVTSSRVENFIIVLSTQINLQDARPAAGWFYQDQGRKRGPSKRDQFSRRA